MRITQIHFALAAYVSLAAPSLLALDPHKALTQYTRAVWTQGQGLPQDTIRAIAQTSDGYLWLGTEEGLARFDGYDFVTFTKGDGSLPSNSITALAAGKDGSLWIGTPNGLSHYANRRFTTFKVEDGLPDNAIGSLLVDHSGILWIIAGVSLSSFQDGKFFEYPAAQLLPVKAARVIYDDQQNTLWIGGLGGLVKRVGKTFVSVLGPQDVNGEFVNAMLKARNGDLWVAGTKGLIRLTPAGRRRTYDEQDGLPDKIVRALWEDRGGNLWAGTNEGLSRLQGGRFVASSLDGGVDRDLVRCLFEDREGNLWVGMNSGLNRLRDDRFTIYGRTEGLPSDEPIAVHQDRNGVIWIGYHDDGLVAFYDGKFTTYTSRDGLASDEIFSIRESRNGDLLVLTRGGLSRMHEGRFSTYVVPDPLGRVPLYDALEDRHGQLWVSGSVGVSQMTAHGFRNVIPSAPVVGANAVVLSEAPDGAIWAGTYGNGLWQIKDGKTRHFDTTDGLSSNQIHSLYQDPDGALWIGTFGGGLNELRNGAFTSYAAKDGLLSDNVSHIDDDRQGSLWLSTTRGISRVSKQQLRDFAAGRIHMLTPVNYGLDDGLRSTQCAPGYPAGGGGTRTMDGRLWFPTSRGLAVINPRADAQFAAPVSPLAQILEVNLDGQEINLDRPVILQPGPGHIQFRYTGILLSAPERVRYDYKLEGLDHDWISGSNRRVINYNSLHHGKYRFLVRASLPGQASSEASLGIEVLPHFYETQAFRWLFGAFCIASIYGLYQLRLRQIRGRFSLVLEERARMAREIHDTLAQGFVGISSQLDALSLKLNRTDGMAGRHLELAQKMARHSLTEARRSVMDLRASALEDHNLASALSTAARQWTASSLIPVDIEVTRTNRGSLEPHHDLPQDVEQNVLRIAQEAVTNVLKHAGAKSIAIRLEIGQRDLTMSVKDDGCGFEPSNVFLTAGGHFGLLGMRERVERLGGKLDLSSQPGTGTQVKITVPLSPDTAHQATWKRRLLALARAPRPARS